MNYRIVSPQVLANFLNELGITDYKVSEYFKFDGTIYLDIKVSEAEHTFKQRRLWEMWVTDICKECGYTTKEIKGIRNTIKKKVLGYEKIYYQDGTYELQLRSSKTATKKEFIELINEAQEIADTCNVKLKQPAFFGY